MKCTVARNELRQDWPAHEAIRHVFGCPSCRKKIDEAIEKNPNTRYDGKDAEEVLARHMAHKGMTLS